LEILGDYRSEIIDKNWFRHSIENPKERDKAGVLSSFYHQKSLLVPEFEAKVNGRGGVLRLVSSSKTTIMGNMGNSIGTSSSTEDFTDRKKLEITKQRYT
jgi:hypothetical protein